MTTPERLASALPWPITVSAEGPIAAGALASRSAGRIVVTAIVKASYEFASHAPMTPVAADELVLADAHVGGDVRRGLVAASDLAPYRPRADVLLTGHATLRGPVTPLRLAVSGRHVALDKTLHLMSRGPFAGPVSVPLVHEEAVGGPGREDNPAGTAAPRLVDPAALGRPGCFAPIPRAWPARNRLLGGADGRRLEGVFVDVPADLDWDHYQAAPADQRVPFLAGDEWILLAGLHPTLPTFKTQLPDVRARVEIRGVASGPMSVEMHLDTLHVDVDRERCHVVFRGSVAVPAGVPLPGLKMFAQVESGTQARRPSEVRPGFEGTIALHVVDDSRAEEQSTAVLRDGTVAALRALGAPFEVTGPSSGRKPAPEIPGAPWASVKVVAAPVPDALHGTFELPKSIVASMRALVDADASARSPNLVATPPPAPSEPPKPVPREAIWAPAPALEARRTPAPVAPIRPEPPAAAKAVRKDVYGGFGPRKRH